MARLIAVGKETFLPFPLLHALEQEGVEVIRVTSLGEAREHLSRERVDVLFLDEAGLSEDPEGPLLALRQTAPLMETVRFVDPSAFPRRLTEAPDDWFVGKPVNVFLCLKLARHLRRYGELLTELRRLADATEPEEGEYHLVHDEWFAIVERLARKEE
jgi:DNA-binding NtrC family response regulator